MRRGVVKTLSIALGVLIVLVAIVGFVHDGLLIREPVDDMRQRVDALPIPSDFVLVSESYRAGASLLFGERPQLHRVYHAAWPRACEEAEGIRARAGKPLPVYQRPPEEAAHVCELGAEYGSAWGGAFRVWRYMLRVTVEDTVAIQQRGPQRTQGEIVYFPPKAGYRPLVTIPKGRARVDIELSAHEWF